MQYYHKLRELREDRDLTQLQLADILETTQPQYSKYELGKQEMTVGRLKKLCLFYGVSADYILGLPKYMKWPR